MSVEQSGTAGLPKPASSAQLAHVKGKPHAGGACAPAEAGDFSSLLMSLGSQEDGATGALADAALPPALGEDALLSPELLLAQALQLQPELPTTSPVPGTLELAGTQTSLQMVNTGAQRALPAGPEAARLEATAWLGVEPEPDTLAAASHAEQKEKKELALASLGTAQSAVLHEDARSVSGRLAAEEHAGKLIRAGDKIAHSSALPQLALAAGISEPGIKQTERATERSAFKQIGGSEGGLWGHQALLEAGRIDAPAPTTGASALSPEMRVAEQVNYWIGRDVQNAELKLDGLGDSPVKVSISLQGNEARIEFRTDQAQARQLLEGAVSHLRDLLGSEGLVLSSVSVGDSGSGRGDPRDGQAPQHRRQVALPAPETLAAEAARRPARLTGRTLDLFV